MSQTAVQSQSTHSSPSQTLPSWTAHVISFYYCIPKPDLEQKSLKAELGVALHVEVYLFLKEATLTPKMLKLGQAELDSKARKESKFAEIDPYYPTLAFLSDLYKMNQNKEEKQA
mmetsp:Transcript_12988/g.16964  ORF Transcript_12988/g.16964 Transcript_12988/m.16964 type:complete len:115 (-) Transcript_12988:48-392(-)